MPDIDSMQAHFILSIADQSRSADCYAHTLNRAPHLDVPGMPALTLGPQTTCS